ncbi:MAG TPA: hypothetical protein VL284_11285 [Thermoanaerobaculia bacterium]|nr:hypothetical protein [Thermoanaerobaculia bacterium]
MIALLSSSVFAATRTWTGTTNGNWTTASNWGGTAPTLGDDLVFPASGANQTTTNDFPAAFLFNSITLSGGAYTLGGDAITLGPGGVTTSGGTAQTISLPITLNTSQTWQFSTANTQFGPIDLAGAALTIAGASSSQILILGPVSGSGSITLTPDSFVDFNGTNSTTAPITATKLVPRLFQ